MDALILEQAASLGNFTINDTIYMLFIRLVYGNLPQL